jgi:hypothetical protein
MRPSRTTSYPGISQNGRLDKVRGLFVVLASTMRDRLVYFEHQRDRYHAAKPDSNIKRH